MTDEELTALHGEVSQQVAFRKSGEIVYEEDGITITWVGMVALWNNGDLPERFGFILDNNTGKDYYFNVQAGGINGIKLNLNCNYPEPLENGIGYYTGSVRNWLFEPVMLTQLNITHADTIYLHIDLYEKPQTGTGNPQEVVRTIKISFPVNFDIP